MQDRPDAISLIEAIQDFLMKEVMPSAKGNELLSYKTLVSWNMLGVISREFKLGGTSQEKEIQRINEYFLKSTSISDSDLFKQAKEKLSTLNLESSYFERAEVAKILNKALSETIRENKLSFKDKEVWNLAREGVKEKLEISNPRFNSGD